MADALSDATVTSYIGDNSNITATFAATLKADTITKQQAEATAASGGLFAAGASQSAAASDSNTASYAGKNSRITANTINIQAKGTDENFASTTAGSGGVVAGAAAVAKTRATGTTQAALQDGAIVTANTLAINAAHTTLFNATANSINASLVGASGIKVSHDVDTDVLAAIGNNVTTTTAGDTTMKAVNTSIKEWRGDTSSGDKADWNLAAAGGGVASGAAVDSDVNVTHDANVTVGNNSNLTVGSGSTVGSFLANAESNITVRDKARINTGGAIAIANVDSRINAKGNAKVDIGSSAITSDTGQIKAGTKNNANLDNRVAADAYGIAGAPAGTAYSNFTGNNQVTVASGAKLIADNDISLTAGRDTNGTAGAVNANAVVNLWNKTVIPINSKPNPAANITNNSTIAINGYVGSANDIYLTADKGTMNATYTGTGKDLYREALATIGTAISELFGGDEVNLDIKGGSRSTDGSGVVNINGTVETGLKRTTTLSFGGSYQQDGKGGYHWVYDPATIAGEGKTHTTEHNKAIADSMTERLNELLKLKAAYAGDTNAVSAYNAEISFLQEKMVSMGLAAWKGSGNNRTFVPLTGMKADFITVKPITVRLGDIRINADNLIGNGTLHAPGDAAITITNSSPAFLTVNNLIVRDGGSILFNGAAVKNNADINAFNTSKAGAVFTNVKTKANTQLPVVAVKSTFNPNALENKRLFNGVAVALAAAPDITLSQGSTISNVNGLVKVESNSGSIYANGSINAGTVDIQAANGDFIQSYINGFNHIGGDPENIHKGNTTPGGIIANGNVFISARLLNVNGLIQSGIADWSLVLSNDVRVSVRGSNKTLAEARNDYLAGGTGLYTVVGGYTGNIGDKKYVTYNAITEEFNIGGVEVHGGLVRLHGQIINTAADGASTGKIRALDGYGTISITNSSGKDIRLNELYNGDGKAGVIDITDTGRNVRTVYTSNRGNVTVTENNVEQANANYNYSANGERGMLTYKPQSNLFYNWTTGTDYSFTQYYHYESDDVFGYTYQSGTTPKGTPTYSTPGTPTPMVNGIYLSEGRPYAWNIMTGVSKAEWEARYYTKATKAVDTGIGEYNMIKEWTKRHWYTLGIFGTYYQDYSITTPKKNITTNSVNASNPIGIEFIGKNRGTVAISGGRGNVLLQGAITNKEGVTSIDTAKYIWQVGDAPIITDNLNLNAAADVGSASKAVRAIIGNTLNASSTNGNVNVTQVLGDLKLGTVTADNGTLSLTADGSIKNSTSSEVRGRRVDITSINGGIGSSVKPLTIKTGNTENYLDANYGLKATALNDINIDNIAWSRNTAGNLLVDTVESRTGIVKLKTAGQMIDNNTDEQIDRRTWNQLTSYWDSLQLRASTTDNAAKRQQTITSYVNGKNADYQAYWQLQNKIVNGAYVFAAGEQATLTAQGINSTEFAAAKVADYQRLEANGVDRWNGGRYDASFTYAMTNLEQTALLKGASWTDRELAISLAPGALKQLTDTMPIVKAPNVKGRNVTLEAGGGIGSNLAPIVINTSTLPRDLSPEQKVALAAAERADMIIDNVAKTISIAQRKPVNVETMGGLLTATAGSFAYLGSEANVTVNKISATGDVRLKITGSIQAGNAGNNIFGKNIILESANGGIGTYSMPLNLGHSGTTTARAADNIYLYQDAAQGDMKVDTIYSLKAVSLEAQDSIRSSDDNEDDLNIMSQSLRLISGKAIGNSAKALGIALDKKGELTAQAQTGINLSHIGERLTVANAETLTGDISLFARQDILVNQIKSTTGDVHLNAGKSILNANRGGNGVNIIGKNLVLTAQDGTIGNPFKKLMVSGNVKPFATKGIYLDNLDNPLYTKIEQETILAGNQFRRSGSSGDNGGLMGNLFTSGFRSGFGGQLSEPTTKIIGNGVNIKRSKDSDDEQE